MMKRLLLSSAAGALSIASANAFPTSLTADGLTFSNITCSVPTSIGTTVGGCGGLDAVPAPGGKGLQIQGTLLTQAPPTSALDVVISYQLASATPITGIGMDFNASVSPPGGSSSSNITEQAFTGPGGTLLGTGSVDTATSSTGQIALSTPETSLFEVKDIRLAAFNSQSVELSTIDQTFSSPPSTPSGTPEVPPTISPTPVTTVLSPPQIAPTAVPPEATPPRVSASPITEPTGLAVLGAGLIGLGLVRHKRS